jgi:hypothetical protein
MQIADFPFQAEGPGTCFSAFFFSDWVPGACNIRRCLHDRGLELGDEEIVGDAGGERRCDVWQEEGRCWHAALQAKGIGIIFLRFKVGIGMTGRRVPGSEPK